MSSITPEIVREDAERVARLALAEDGPRDITTDVTIVTPVETVGRIEFRHPGVLAGTVYAEAVARACQVGIRWEVAEGNGIDGDQVIGSLTGDLGRMLRAERPLLNLLQRASGIASMTRRFVEAVQGTRCRVLHTRKTSPGLRIFDLAAVVAGGGAACASRHADALKLRGEHLDVASRGRARRGTRRSSSHRTPRAPR